MNDPRKLTITVAGERELAMVRAFDAPRRLVFKAMTQPELVKRWLLGPPGWSLPVCEIDLRPGGKLRYVWRNTDGREMGMGGVYQQIAPPERLVHTELFDEDWTGGETTVTDVLSEAAGRTTLTMTVRYASRDARDAAMRSGMERGVAASYDRLAEIMDEPQVTETGAGLTAVLRVTVPRAQIRDVMGPGLGELRAALAAQGVTPTGPWFTHHLRITPDTFDFEIGLPVAAPVAPAGRVRPGERPALTVARMVHRGGFEGLPQAWPKLDAWVRAQGRTPAEDMWEHYLVGPESSPDPAAWRTELVRPLAQGG